MNNLVEKLCKICRKPIAVKRNRRYIYCEDCRNSEAYLVERPCKMCGKTLKVKRSIAAYCNDCKESVEFKEMQKSKTEKRKKTNRAKYGADNPLKNKEVQERHRQSVFEKHGVYNNFLVKNEKGEEKRKITMLEMHGVEFSFSSPEIREKKRQTMVKRYGIENPFQDTKKLKETWIKKYGVDNPNKSRQVREKTENTVKEKYGVACTFNNKDEDGVEKRKKTCLENFGAEHVWASDYGKKKIKETNLEKHGTEFSSSDPIVKMKRKNTCLNRYGVETNLLLPEVLKKRLKFTKIHQKLKEEIVKQISEHSFETETYITINHRHFSIDELDRFKKIAIFVDGDYWHANPLKFQNNSIIAKTKTAEQVWEYDKQVTQQLETAGYTVLRFWQDDINKNLQQCIEKIKDAINIKNHLQCVV